MLLASAALPSVCAEQARAKAALEEQVPGRRVELTMVGAGSEKPEYLAIARVPGLDINGFMLEKDHLRSPRSEQAAGRSPVAVKAPSKEPKKRSPVWRYLLWAAVGFFASTGLGMILAGDQHGWIVFVGVLVAIGWSVYSSWSAGSIWPPIVGLAVVFVFAGIGAKAHRLRISRR